MAHNGPTWRWVGLASGKAISELRNEVARLTQQLSALGSRLEQTEGAVARLAGEVAGMRATAEQDRREEIDALRRDVSALRERLPQGDRLSADADDLAQLQRRLESKETDVETLRLKVAGLAEQMRWDSEELRKALTALAERTERRS